MALGDIYIKEGGDHMERRDIEEDGGGGRIVIIIIILYIIYYNLS